MKGFCKFFSDEVLLEAECSKCTFCEGNTTKRCIYWIDEKDLIDEE